MRYWKQEKTHAWVKILFYLEICDLVSKRVKVEYMAQNVKYKKYTLGS